jgi:hypothetical protein
VVPALTTTSAGKTATDTTAAGKAAAGKAKAGKAAAGTTPPGTTPPGTTPAGKPPAGTTPAGAAPATTTSVVTAAPTAPVPTTAAATHPDGDYLIVGTDAFPVRRVFCDRLEPGAANSGSGQIAEIDGTAEGLGPFFYVIDDGGFTDGIVRQALFSVSSTDDNGAVFFRGGELAVHAPLSGPAVLLSGKGALDPVNTLSDYVAALDLAIGADRMTEIKAGAPPTAEEQATILQLHERYYSTPFTLSVTC